MLKKRELKAVNHILCFITGADSEDEIKPEFDLLEDFGFDEFDKLEFCDMLEEQFEIVIPSDDYYSIFTVDDVYNTVEKLLNKKENK